MVWPDRLVTTSPGRWALPSGMFSASAQTPTTLALALRPAIAAIAPATAPAPPMSHFIASIPSAGLIEMPPVSKVMPLPTRTTGVAPALPPFQRIASSRDGRTEPCADSEQGAHAELAHLLLVEHLELDPERLEPLAATLDEGLGIDDVGRLGDQLAGQRQAGEQRLAPVPGLAGAVARADDHHFLERRLLLLGQLGPVDVVAPAARRGAEADPGGRLGIEAEPVQIDHQPRLAGGQKLADEGTADLLVQRLVLAAVAQPDEEQAAGIVPLRDEGLRDRGGFALEALGLGGPGGDGSGAGVEPGEAVGDRALAPHRAERGHRRRRDVHWRS